MTHPLEWNPDSLPISIFGIPLKTGEFSLTLPKKVVEDMTLNTIGYPNEHAMKVFNAINALRLALKEGCYI